VGVLPALSRRNLTMARPVRQHRPSQIRHRKRE
jgi:hypothetical protein